MPDVEAFKAKIINMIEQAVLKDGGVEYIVAKKEKNLLSPENLAKIMAMKCKNIIAIIPKEAN
ncbi:hypothetical protein MFMK1_000055 [Metallumcola ferriviriculae]|uniref:Uncharacterized protein n=1 Tax=Metallumcola ferriviriculae TaxID=3039180 RepID=A0AAU0UI89_9FIRM|nr:hypothetical protein MFMK1_000055 [Desulfitibacteraceae bacterium MK1]